MPDQQGRVLLGASVPLDAALAHLLLGLCVRRKKPRRSAVLSDKNRRRIAVNFIIKSRSERRKYFSACLFSEPAWDTMLSLYAASLDEHEASISELAEAANVEESTLTRWLAALQREGLVICNGDRASLSEKGWLAMDSYFEGMSSNMI